MNKINQKQKGSAAVWIIAIVVIAALVYLIATYSNSKSAMVDTGTNQAKSTNSTTTSTSSADSKNFVSAKGFSIVYPSDFQVQESLNGGDFFNELNLYSLELRTAANYQKGTDFEIAFINILVSSSTAACYTASPIGRSLSSTKTINGIQFHYDSSQPFEDDAMGGARGKDSLFAAIHNGQCYRIDKLIGYRDPRGFTDPPYPPHFDEAKVNGDIDQIINSFKFTQ